MERRDLEEIERFLTSVGRPSLFEYYGLDPSADATAADEAVKKRRTWAQGQQSNPKYKAEALFLIKNNAQIKRVFVDAIEDYRLHVRDDAQGRNLEVLTLFIRGTLAGGQLTPQAESAIVQQGRQLELSDAAITRRLEEVLAETGATRVGFDNDDLSADALAMDHYAVLGVATNVAHEGIEEAYRSRYRWARNLKDLKRSAEVLSALDQAWRILSDPAKRARYDERRLQMMEMTDEVEKRSVALLGLLGAPDPLATGTQAGVLPLAAARSLPPVETDVRGAPLPPRAAPQSPGPSALQPESSAPAVEPAPRTIRLAEPRGAPVQPVGQPAGPPPQTLRLAEPRGGARPGARAPAPPPVAGRTIGVTPGRQPIATLGPRLTVDGPDVVSVTVGGGPVTRRWTVRNSGQGKMPGRVTSDRDWLRVEPARLDANAENQTVSVTVVPEQLPWGRTAGTLTIVTDHGQRRTMTVQVRRRSWLRIAAVTAAVAAACVVIVAELTRTDPAEAATSFALTVDPVADRVVVDGQELGKGTRFSYEPARSTGSLSVRIEADGFTAHEEVVQLRAGERTVREVSLSLEDPMDWTPPSGVTPAATPPGVRAGIDAAGPALARCYSATPGVRPTYQVWVTADGQARRVVVSDAPPTAEGALPCVRRVLRGLRLPPFGAPYTLVDTRTAPPAPR